MAHVVDWNRARWPSLAALPRDRDQLLAQLVQVDEAAIWGLIHETGHAVSARVGAAMSSERYQLINALITSWASSAELFLMNTIERLRSKSRLLNACDASLFQAIRDAVARWDRGVILISLTATETILAKLRALFGDLDGVFCIQQTADNRMVVSLSEQIPIESWKRYLSAAFEQPLDDDMQTEDASSSSLPPLWMFPTLSAASSPTSSPDKPFWIPPILSTSSPDKLVQFKSSTF